MSEKGQRSSQRFSHHQSTGSGSQLEHPSECSAPEGSGGGRCGLHADSSDISSTDKLQLDCAGFYVHLANNSIDIGKTSRGNLQAVVSQHGGSIRTRCKYNAVYVLACWLLLAVNVVRRLPWTYRSPYSANWSDDSVYPRIDFSCPSASGLFFSQAVLLAVLLHGALLERSYALQGTARRGVLHVLLVLLLVKAAEVVTNYGLHLSGHGDKTFSCSPVEALATLAYSHVYRNSLHLLRRTLPRFLVLAAVFSLMFVTYCALGFLIIDTPYFSSSERYFGSFPLVLWSMLMMLNGSDWPTPMMGVYDQNRCYAAFFVAFLLFFNWGLLNLVLSFVYIAFREESSAIRGSGQDLKVRYMYAAFHLVCDTGIFRESSGSSSHSRTHCSYEQVARLVQRYYDCYHLGAQPSYAEALALSRAVDCGGAGHVCLEDFVLSFQAQCLAGALCALRAQATTYSSFFFRDLSGAAVGGLHQAGPGRAATPVAPERSVASGLFSSARKAVMGRRSGARSSSTPGGQDEDTSLDFSTPSGSGSFFQSFMRRTGSAADLTKGLLGSGSFSDDGLGAPPELDRITASSDVFDRSSVYVPQSCGLQSALARLAHCIDRATVNIDTVYFDIVADVAILAASALFIFDAQVAFLVVFTTLLFLQLALKLAAVGYYRHRRSYNYIADKYVSAALLCSYLTYAYHRADTGEALVSHFCIRGVVAVRATMSVRLLLHALPFGQAKMADRVRETVAALLARSTDFGALLVVMVLYLYSVACVGGYAFGGLISKGGGSESLQQSLYGASGFYPLNFNDVSSGVVTLFTLLSVNNMHVTASGFVSVTTVYSELFFVAFYASGVLFLLNVISAVIINEFLTFFLSEQNSPHNSALPKSPESSDRKATHGRSGEDSADGSLPDVTGIVPDDSIDYYRAVTVDSSDDPALHSTSSKLVSIVALNTAKNKSSAAVEDVDRASHKFDYPIHPFNPSALGAPAFGRGFFGADHDLLSLYPSSDVLLHEPHYGLHRADTSSAAHSSTTTGSLRPATLAGASSTIYPHERAAIFVQYARDGIVHSTLPNTRLGLRCYQLRNRLSRAAKLATWLLVLLRLFERPLWTFDASKEAHWGDSGVYPTFGTPFIAPAAEAAVKLPMLLLLLLCLGLEYLCFHGGAFWNKSNINNAVNSSYKSYSSNKKFWLMPLSFKLRLLLILFNCIQILLLVLTIAFFSGKHRDSSSGASSTIGKLFWLFSLGNVFYIFWFDNKALTKLRLILAIVPFHSLLVLLLLLLALLFGAYGPYVYVESGASDDFSGGAAAGTYFSTYGEGVWSVFVAVSTSSYPLQVLPGYREDRGYFLFFGAFVTLGTFGLLNVALVNVLIQFDRRWRGHLDVLRRKRNLLLYNAYICLNVQRAEHVEKQQVADLLAELYDHYSEFRKRGVPTATKRELLLAILDVDGDEKISLRDFNFLIEVTKLDLKQESHTAATSSAREDKGMGALLWVRSGFFSLGVDALGAGAVAAYIAVYKSRVARGGDARGVLAAFLAVLTTLYSAEFALKIAVFGWKPYRIKSRNKVDSAVAAAMVALCIYMSASGYRDIAVSSDTIDNVALAANTIMMVRPLLLPRNLHSIFPQSFSKNFSMIVRKVVRSIYTVAEVFIVAVYVYSTLGIVLFGGKICTSSADGCADYDAVAASAYGANGYWALNFNDYASALVTLFCCLHVSNFDVIASGFAATKMYGQSSQLLARTYFAVWYCTGVLLLLNILKSFFLSGFVRFLKFKPRHPLDLVDRESVARRIDSLVSVDYTASAMFSDSNKLWGRDSALGLHAGSGDVSAGAIFEEQQQGYTISVSRDAGRELKTYHISAEYIRSQNNPVQVDSLLQRLRGLSSRALEGARTEVVL